MRRGYAEHPLPEGKERRYPWIKPSIAFSAVSKSGTSTSVHPEMVECGSDQGRSVFETAGVARLR